MLWKYQSYIDHFLENYILNEILSEEAWIFIFTNFASPRWEISKGNMKNKVEVKGFEPLGFWLDDVWWSEFWYKKTIHIFFEKMDRKKFWPLQALGWGKAIKELGKI